MANVKWLKRIEVVDHRYTGRFMARDYVSIREEQCDGQTVWTFATVSHDRLKSAPAKVTRRQNRYSIMGAAWGAPIAAVEVQIDDGPWAATWLESHAPHRKRSRGYAWRFWTFEWGRPPRASTRFGRGRSTSTVTSNQRRTTHPQQQKDLLGEQRADNPPGQHSLTVRGVCCAKLLQLQLQTTMR